MRSVLVLGLVALAAALGACPAHAQFGAPLQSPLVEPQGTLTLYPTLGVYHDPGATDFSVAARARYSLLDELSAHLVAGGLVGDLNLFDVGAGLKFAALTRKAGFPVEVSGFTDIDFSIGDATIVSWLSGPLVGLPVTIDRRHELVPYGGFGLGLTRVDLDDRASTETGFGFLLGTEYAIDDLTAAFTELTIGVGDGQPRLLWQIGMSYELFVPAGWQRRPAVEPLARAR